MKRRHPAFYAGISTLVIVSYLLIVGTSPWGLLAAVTVFPAIFWIMASSRDAGQPIPRWLTLSVGAIGFVLFSYQFATLDEYSVIAVLPWFGVMGFSVACLWFGIRGGWERSVAR